MDAGKLRRGDPDAATGRLLALYKSMVLMPRILNNVGASPDADIDEVARESVETFLTRYSPSR